MKKHLINIWFETPENGNFAYCGFVTEKIENGKAVFYPQSLFKQLFGFDMPSGTRLSPNRNGFTLKNTQIWKLN